MFSLLGMPLFYWVRNCLPFILWDLQNQNKCQSLNNKKGQNLPKKQTKIPHKPPQSLSRQLEIVVELSFTSGKCRTFSISTAPRRAHLFPHLQSFPFTSFWQKSPPKGEEGKSREGNSSHSTHAAVRNQLSLPSNSQFASFHMVFNCHHSFKIFVLIYKFRTWNWSIFFSCDCCCQVQGQDYW